ncbi:MAG: heme-binding protein [Actinobacteria bacterium]|jgi:glc operon protein GlcG|uniref:Unannotated protein n=1 Tax=freshwater metagenome TaxID=449393 RepID=A0A6J7JZT7_9ZZZZ|nr:heme-binding protein [Actinomycetota bacterium]
MTALSQALAIVEHVRTSAEESGLRVSCSVVDAQGHEIVTMRMDRATWFTPGIARVKAQTAAALKRDTSALGALREAFPDLLDQVGEQLSFTPTTLSGGVIHASGVAVGVSGAHPDQDVSLAKGAIAHVLDG